VKNRYVLSGATWVTGAYARVAKTAGEVGHNAMEKVASWYRQHLHTTTSIPSWECCNCFELSCRVYNWKIPKYFSWVWSSPFCEFCQWSCDKTPTSSRFGSLSWDVWCWWYLLGGSCMKGKELGWEGKPMHWSAVPQFKSPCHMHSFSSHCVADSKLWTGSLQHTFA
jgi:hypothetical protein